MAPLVCAYKQKISMVSPQTPAVIFAAAVDRLTRNESIYEATRVYGYRLKEVGNHLGLYYSTDSIIARRVAESRTPRKKT